MSAKRANIGRYSQMLRNRQFNKKPVFMRVCGHFEARRTTRHDPNDVAPKRMLLGSITRNGAAILIEFFLKPFRILTTICIQYVAIDLCNHVCLRVAGISLHRLNVSACQDQLIGDTAVA